MTIEIQGICVKGTTYETAQEAIEWAEQRGDWARAISADGGYAVVEECEAHRLEAAGIQFAYIHNVALPDGSRRIVTVPIN